MDTSKIAWRISRGRGQQYVLRNVGTVTAQEVTADTVPFEGIPTRGLPEKAVIETNASITFMLVPSAQNDMPGELRLRWEGQDTYVAVPLPN
ncbi:hypothetical protein DQ384_05385 [Sphaerisporangium album]|uniref:Uncharacterized protein n=1 Tax=Sphaerisporangium album TaxID=509200 RepID=A0A367FNJ5_9ACTN|nr:hypothetical protein [Sphaerisporangium album]RCG31976.1 hypothetical protein DQ384_05385 [Sphaerisporangium album]